ncbi:MAG: hypothetical protein ACKOZW_02485 [Cyanobium sp.]
MVEMGRSVRLDRAQALRELQELRQLLHLDADDHHTVLEGLGRDHPELMLAPLLPSDGETHPPGLRGAGGGSAPGSGESCGR